MLPHNEPDPPLLVAPWWSSHQLDLNLPPENKDVFVSLLFGHDDATYISGVINDGGVGHVSARSSSIEDEAGQWRSEEGTSSSHAGENTKS